MIIKFANLIENTKREFVNNKPIITIIKIKNMSISLTANPLHLFLQDFSNGKTKNAFGFFGVGILFLKILKVTGSANIKGYFRYLVSQMLIE